MFKSFLPIRGFCLLIKYDCFVIPNKELTFIAWELI